MAVEEKRGPGRPRLEKQGNMVCLRGEKVPLEGTVCIEGRKDERFCLMPNKWTEVSDPVLAMLKRKFGSGAHEMQVLDAEENQKHPHPPGGEPRYRDEDRSQYIIEGLDGR